ncbi:S-layer homology domain-containing protein [Paenibacillus sp. NPDC058174]|uniref:S-layer homology domain-containing protein n=1 Tax=Paenibacillus sp. NPDC058174 TaxID=3346366 RepID=UPI0036D87887
MKKRSIFSTLAAMVLLLPIVGAFAGAVLVVPVSAASATSFEGQMLTNYQIHANAVYSSWATQYTFSDGGSVQQSASPPAEADWVTPSNYYDGAWNHLSWNKVYTYSNFGLVAQTNDPLTIPPTAAWATISSFQVETVTSAIPIKDPVFRYSINGTDVQTVSNALDIPPNALWAALASFNDGWHQTINHTFWDYTLERTVPSVQSFIVSSNSGNPVYAKSGNRVTVALQTDIPIEAPVLKIAGTALTVTGSGTNWSASLDLSGAIADGTLSVFASIYTEEGAPGPIVTATTDSSTVVLDNTAPVLSYYSAPVGPTRQDVTVQVAASDPASGVELTKWAAGTQTAAYFATQGAAFTDSFIASANGSYTVYARDRAGNEALLPVTVSSIDRNAPVVSLTANTTAPANADIEITVSAVDESPIAKQLWAAGLQDAAYFQGGSGNTFADHFPAAANGLYSVYVEDAAGNHTLKTITVSNLFRQAPEITLTPVPLRPTNDTVIIEVEVQIEGEDEGNELVELRWSKGEQDTAYFADGGGEDIVAYYEFEGDENGRYSVYARDAAGNETVSFIDIANIDRTAPTLTLTPDVTAPTNGNVTITVDAADADSGLEDIRWSAVEPLPDMPWPSREVQNGSFIAESNGTYTVIAFDNARNETIRQISVTNIMRDKPTLLLSPETTGPVGNKAAVSVEASAVGAGNRIAVIRWAAGELPVEFFYEGLSEDITQGKQFDAPANGTYTVYARDLAGNESIETIEINNIRSTNTALAALAVSNAGQELSISPAYSPEQLHYTLRVDSKVESITLTAGTVDGSAAVAVNGQPLAAGASASVTLNSGVNTIHIVVTAELASAQRTYTIEVTRERPASSGSETGAGTGSGTVQNNAFVAKLNGKVVAGLNETSKSSSDGTVYYNLKLNDAAAIAALAEASGKNVLSIVRSGESASQISGAELTLSSKTLTQLKERGIGVVFDIGAAVYEMPAGISVPGGGDLVVQLKALRQPADIEQLLSGAIASASHHLKPKSVGTSIAFTSNAAEAKGTDAGHVLVLPLPKGLDAAALHKVAVYLENGSDSKSVLPGTLRYDAQGNAIGIAVASGAPGRAAVIQAEPVTVAYESYIKGYANGSFAPARAVTRAELAALLMKLSPSQGNGSASGNAVAFGDVPQTHWAAEAIAYAAAAGWMKGSPDGLFHPGESLTRAELAAVLVRWCAVQATGHASFSDAASHWASAEIAAAEREGWVTGYEDGSFRPGRSVTRAEVVTVLNRVLGRPQLAEGGPAWSDVPTSHWAAGAIRSASQSFEALYYLSGKVEPIIK